MKLNSVRIIGGQWRRLQIHFPDSIGLRPTPDRVRETLFNWLGQDLHGQYCLDLFAGSGALGFEAASRHAAKVVMVEQELAVRKMLLDNQKHLNALNSVEIFGGDALKFAARKSAELANTSGSSKKFDVLFLDPPYHKGWLQKIELFLDPLMNPEGAIYVEAETPLAGLGSWQTTRQGKAGQVHYHLMRRLPPEASEIT